MTTALSTWLNKGEIRDRIGKAIGKAFDPDFFIEQILISLNHPNLSKCTLESKFEAAHTCAALGMLPGMQHVALIPRNLRDQGEICTVMPQWQGLASLMLRHPNVQRISHSLVHPGDEFEFDGTSQEVTHHQYDPFADVRQFATLNDIRGGYLKVFLRDGSPTIYHMVKRSTIDKARKCAQADNIWKNWFEEQCIKTLYRNGFARRVVPIDPMLNQLQLQAAMTQEDEVIGNDPARVQPAAVVTHEPARPVDRTAAVAQRLSGPAEAPEIPAEQSEQNLFVTYRDRILKANSIDDLHAINSEIQIDADQISDSEINELTGLMNQAAEGVQQKETTNA